MVLIAKNEAHNVDRCLSSFWDSCDEVVLCDTGSTDRTIAKAKEFAKRKKQPGKLVVGHFDWIDDFAAARQYADGLASGEWLCWADLDDEVFGLATVRQQAKDASSDVVSFFAHYDYARDEHGNCLSELWRERVTRADGSPPWNGRLHEHKLFTGGTMVQLDPQIARWHHHRTANDGANGERNLRILTKWNQDEPGNPRVLQSLAMEYMGAERHKDASDTFAAYLECEGEATDRRCQAARYLAVQLLMQSRVSEAQDVAYAALRESFTWADTHLSLAECAQTLDDPQAGYLHAKQALELGKPATLLILNPLQYTAHPRALMAVCLAQLGKFDEAVRLGEEVLRIAPSYQLAAQNLPGWRGALKKENATGAFLACAEVLAEAGELEKAKRLLEQAPWFVIDAERVVRRRGELFSEMRRRHPVAVEDPAADAFVQRHLVAA